MRPPVRLCTAAAGRKIKIDGTIRASLHASVWGAMLNEKNDAVQR